jgi:nicotinamidase-related amidase
MDIQNGIVSRFGARDDYLDRVVAAQATAEAARVPVILVRVGFNPGYPEVSPRNAVFSAIRSSGRMQLGDRDCEPHDHLLRGKGEIVVTTP